MIDVQVKRFSDNNKTSLGVIYIKGIAQCGSIEDREQKGDKVRGESRVSDGIYRLALRNEGGLNSRYLKKYGKDYHKGMLCVYNAKDWKLNCPDGKSFQYILIHLGNSEKDTHGCLLPNYVLDFLNDRGSRSGDAYKDLYPKLRDLILSSGKVDELGIRYIDIEYSDVESGK